MRPLSLFETTKLAEEVVFEEGCSMCGVHTVFAFESGPRQIVVFTFYRKSLKKTRFHDTFCVIVCISVAWVVWQANLSDRPYATRRIVTLVLLMMLTFQPRWVHVKTLPVLLSKSTQHLVSKSCCYWVILCFVFVQSSNTKKKPY